MRAPCSAAPSSPPLHSAGKVLFPALVFGCATVPPSTVSPVDIEETREDSKILEKDLLAARARARELSTELAAKKAEYDGKKDKPEELRKKLEELKKGSGRIDARRGKKKKGKKDEDEKETA